MLAIIIPIGRNNAQGSTIAGINVGIGFGAPIRNAEDRTPTSKPNISKDRSIKIPTQAITRIGVSTNMFDIRIRCELLNITVAVMF
jgi:hypothetical protein